MPNKQNTALEDDVKEPIVPLVEHRLPWLIVGLLGGIITSIVVAKYEDILAADVRLAFFIPFIVYMSSAVGTQTETIYVRHLKGSGASVYKYLLKEIALGLSLGTIFGIVVAFFTFYWLESLAISFTVGLSMFVNITMAPALAICVAALLYKEHTDPALGAGPLGTIIQDLVSLLVYFLIASLIIF